MIRSTLKFLSKIFHLKPSSKPTQSKTVILSSEEQNRQDVLEHVLYENKEIDGETVEVMSTGDWDKEDHSKKVQEDIKWLTEEMIKIKEKLRGKMGEVSNGEREMKAKE